MINTLHSDAQTSLSLLKHFFFLFLPAVIIVACLLGMFHFLQVRAEQTILEAHELGHVFEGRKRINNALKQVSADLYQMANSPTLFNFLEKQDQQARIDLEMEYRNLAISKNLYDQVRFLDATGMEAVRVNYTPGAPIVVPVDKLQHKGKRYYFSDTFVLDKDDIFVSPLDLNIEHGKIEYPLKPMIRFGTPVYDSTGIKQGIILLNYLGAIMLSEVSADMAENAHGHTAVKHASRRHTENGLVYGQSMLLNLQGYWLLGLQEEDEWGFMFGNKRTFGKDFPQAWATVSSLEEGQLRTAQGMFTFTTIYPLGERQISATGSPHAHVPSRQQLHGAEYSWKLVSFIEQEKLWQLWWQYFFTSLRLFASFVLFLLPTCWYLGKLRLAREMAEETVKRYEFIVNNSTDFMTLVDADYHYQAVSSSFCQAHLKERHEILQATVADIYGQESFIEGIKEHMDRCLAGKKIAYSIWFETPAYGLRYYDVTLTPFQVPGSKKNYCVVVTRDITERKNALDALQKSSRRIELLKNLKEDLLRLSQLDNKLKRITEAVVEIFQADFARIWIVEKGDQCDHGCFHASVTEGPHVCRDRDCCLHLKASSGRYTHIDSKVHGRVPYGCYKIGRIASETENKFLTNDVVSDLRVHNHQWAKNLGLQSFGGYCLVTSEGKSVGVLALFSQQEISKEEDILLEGLANTTAQVVRTVRAEEAIMHTRDSLQAIVDNVDAMIYITDRKTYEIIMANAYIHKRFGEVVGKRCWEVLQLNETGPCSFCQVKELLEGDDTLGKTRIWEIQNARDHCWYECHDRIVRWVDQRLVRLQISTDITERKKNEQKLQEYGAAQKTLLREVNHRVKNNLSAIISMVQMEADQAMLRQKESGYGTMLHDLVSRIHGLATVHNLLSASEWRPLALSHLCEEVIDAALHAVPHGRKAALEVQQEPIQIGSNQAHHLALVLNELTTNTIKHGLTDDQPVCIEVKFSVTDNNIIDLTYKDNGPGFPGETIAGDLSRVNIGMELISGIVTRSLQGEIDFSNEEGAVTHFHFQNLLSLNGEEET